MSDLLSVYDKNFKKIAVLQNAYSITETQELNQIYNLTFSMPYDDPKNQFISPFSYVRWADDKQLYRMVKSYSDNSETSSIKYECEHVIAKLCDITLFTTINGPVTLGGNGVHTREVIEDLLAKQTTVLWKLGVCDFNNEFEYSWEQENLLNALFSIPKDFEKSYCWEYDTRTRPWTINLRSINASSTAKPEYYIRARRNLIDSNSDIDYTNICTKLYPLGYGEGVNQLNISGVNNGNAYLEAPANIINKYGIIEKVLVERRFENAESLKEYGQNMLDSLQEPKVSRSFDVVDLYPLTNNEIDKAEVGKVCRLTMDDTTVYITKTTRVLDDPGNLQIELSTNSSDVTSTIANIADRVRVESVYAQGATQLYQHSKDANASPDKGMVLSLYFPSEMRQINKVLLNVELHPFRSYSQTTEAGGGVAQTDQFISGGGGASKNTENQTVTISGTTAIAEWEGRQVIGSIPSGISYSSSTESPYGPGGDFEQFVYNHYHEFTVTLNNLQFYIAKNELAHTHNFSFDLVGDAHNHVFSLPTHSHTLNLPPHSHNIAAGIYESGNPSAFDIFVGNTKKTSVNSSSWDGDITNWILENGTIPRDTWIRVEIRPNDLAYVVSSVFVKGFVQSRGGGNY